MVLKIFTGYFAAKEGNHFGNYALLEEKCSLCSLQFSLYVCLVPGLEQNMFAERPPYSITLLVLSDVKLYRIILNHPILYILNL